MRPVAGCRRIGTLLDGVAIGVPAVKILTITSSYPKFPGDTTAPFIESITRALAARGHELTLVLPDRSDLEPAPVDGVTFHPYTYAPKEDLAVFGYAEALRADVAVRRSTYLVAPFAITSGAAKLFSLARRGGFDLIHAHWVVPNGAMALPARWWSGLPMVVSLHGSDVFLSEKSLIFNRAARATFRRADAVTACSGDLAERSLGLGAGESPVTIPYGVSTDHFGPSPDEASGLRGTLGLSDDTRVVLAVGRLVHKKGFEFLVEAAPKILEAHPKLSVIIAGQGDLKTELEERARRHGVGETIRLVGNVPRDELPAYYALADIVAVPSVIDDAGNVDGLPNVLLEGMASGSALVASAVAGIPQAVRDGKEALLVAERDPEALAEAIVKLLRSKETRDALGGAARARAQELFDWSRVGERFEAVFNSVAGAGRSSS
jgi:glycosyltransferase involved in cell wall biosynthesis